MINRQFGQSNFLVYIVSLVFLLVMCNSCAEEGEIQGEILEDGQAAQLELDFSELRQSIFPNNVDRLNVFLFGSSTLYDEGDEDIKIRSFFKSQSIDAGSANQKISFDSIPVNSDDDSVCVSIGVFGVDQTNDQLVSGGSVAARLFSADVQKEKSGNSTSKAVTIKVNKNLAQPMNVVLDAPYNIGIREDRKFVLNARPGATESQRIASLVVITESGDSVARDIKLPNYDTAKVPNDQFFTNPVDFAVYPEKTISGFDTVWVANADGILAIVQVPSEPRSQAFFEAKGVYDIGPVSSMNISPDGSLIAVVNGISKTKTITLFSTIPEGSSIKLRPRKIFSLDDKSKIPVKVSFSPTSEFMGIVHTDAITIVSTGIERTEGLDIREMITVNEITSPFDIAISRDGLRAFVSSRGEDQTERITELKFNYRNELFETETGYSAKIFSGSSIKPQNMSLSPNGAWLYVLSPSTRKLGVLNVDPVSPSFMQLTGSITISNSIGESIAGEEIVMSQDGKKAYVIGSATDGVVEINVVGGDDIFSEGACD